MLKSVLIPLSQKLSLSLSPSLPLAVSSSLYDGLRSSGTLFDRLSIWQFEFNEEEAWPSPATSSGYTTAYRILPSLENISERQRRLLEWSECYAFNRKPRRIRVTEVTIVFIVEFVFEHFNSRRAVRRAKRDEYPREWYLVRRG